MRQVQRVAVMAALAVGLLLVAVPAFAHVTVRVDDPSPGAYAEYTLRVPNESDAASTTAVEVQLPDGFEPLVQPVEGWDVAVGDGVMTLSGGAIAPGEYQDFTFVAQNPEEGGEAVFPAIQTYDDGEVAEWIGDEDADYPAALVTYGGEAAEGGEHHDDAAEPAAAGDAEPASAQPAEPAAGPDWLGAAALIAGLAGLVLGALAFARSAPRRTA